MISKLNALIQNSLQLLLRTRTWILAVCFLSVLCFGWLDVFTYYIAPVIFLLWFGWVVAIACYGSTITGKKRIKYLNPKHVLYCALTFLLGLLFDQYARLDGEGVALTTIFYILFTLFRLYCFWYIFIMAARIVAITVYGNDRKLANIVNCFLRLFFFPFGVFAVQPAIRKAFRARMA